MRLLCLDLDNTLVDRTAGFRAWASEFVLRYRIEPLEVGWIMQIDLDGYADRAAVFQQIEARFGVASAEELRAFALDGMSRRLKIIGVPLETL